MSLKLFRPISYYKSSPNEQGPTLTYERRPSLDVADTHHSSQDSETRLMIAAFSTSRGLLCYCEGELIEEEVVLFSGKIKGIDAL